MNRMLKRSTVVATLALMGSAFVSCGIFMNADQGLFNQSNFAPTTVRNLNDLRGLWELDPNSLLNSGMGTQPTNFNNQTRLRMEIDSPQDTALRMTTLCETRNANNSNNMNATYVNAEAWVSISYNGQQAGAPVANMSSMGQIYIQQFRNTATSGEQNAGCVTPIQVGTYSFQVQEGRLFLTSANPINTMGGQNNMGANFSYTFTKIRD